MVGEIHPEAEQPEEQEQPVQPEQPEQGEQPVQPEQPEQGEQAPIEKRKKRRAKVNRNSDE
jgi:hypothetical protein